MLLSLKVTQNFSKLNSASRNLKILYQTLNLKLKMSQFKT